VADGKNLIREGFGEVYNIGFAMSVKTPVAYAVVAYLRGELAEFVENLRRELHPKHAHLPSHITVLPPRPLAGTEAQALEWMVDQCNTVEPFEVVMGDVESFMPTTATVFIRVAHAAYKIRELHDRLNAGPFAYHEELPYMPHLTIAKLETIKRARQVYELARDRWDHYEGLHRARIEYLSFVRGRDAKWTDLAPVRLKDKLVPS
jgi:2'-5' RNA ligase